MTSRALTAGSLGIFEIQGCDQSFVVGGYRLLVFFQALDVAANGVLRHFLRFAQSASIRNAARERWHNGREAAFGLRAQVNVKTEVSLFHGK